MHYCNIIYSLAANFFYIGVAGDLEIAVKRHNNYLCVSTKPFVPWDLVWHSGFETEKEACACESYLKSRRGTEYAYRELIPSFYIGNRRSQRDNVMES